MEKGQEGIEGDMKKEDDIKSEIKGKYFLQSMRVRLAGCLGNDLEKSFNELEYPWNFFLLPGVLHSTYY